MSTDLERLEVEGDTPQMRLDAALERCRRLREEARERWQRRRLTDDERAALARLPRSRAHIATGGQRDYRGWWVPQSARTLQGRRERASWLNRRAEESAERAALLTTLPENTELLARRQALGLSQWTLAKLAGISRGSVFAAEALPLRSRLAPDARRAMLAAIERLERERAADHETEAQA